MSQEVTIDVRLGATVVTTPDGQRKVLLHGEDTGVLKVQVDLPHADHPEAEVADKPWQPLERAQRMYNGREIPDPDGASMWKNDLYTVEMTRHRWPGADDTPVMVHLSIRRNDRHWARDWRHFQRIKNQLVGAQHEGVELYPAESRLMDTANQYHLWVFEDPGVRFPFGYEDGRVVGDGDFLGVGGRQRPVADGDEVTVDESKAAELLNSMPLDPALRQAVIAKITADTVHGQDAQEDA